MPCSGEFDVVVSLSAVPHVSDQRQALEHIHDVTRLGGLLLVQLRNLLFNAFTLNEYTRAFVFH
ncbi:methyltransferase domain-containing protein [Haloarculaceae archaeon H-GB11]|nr:methyltransferase domain-containing protein [Haloarculaceae archaeon H-GB1-1]MEA5388451.1 methyltransferase domain-containing protein [Haloarculaceae archaeon H-GB11]